MSVKCVFSILLCSFPFPGDDDDVWICGWALL